VKKRTIKKASHEESDLRNGEIPTQGFPTTLRQATLTSESTEFYWISIDEEV
jgi:hypothetical protein